MRRVAHLRVLSAYLATSVAIGALSAVFLAGLERVIAFRAFEPRLVFLAPPVGLMTGWIFIKKFPNAGLGHLLLIAHLRRPWERDVLPRIPGILAPLIVGFTWLSHLPGLSVGREGTAVQMGGAVAEGFARLFRVETKSLHLLLLSGIAAGFGSVFGVPLAGAVFALEISKIGKKVDRTSMLSGAGALIAALIADGVARLFGARHVAPPDANFLASPDLRFKSAVALLLIAFTCGLGGWFYLVFLKQVKISMSRLLPREQAWLRPACGGLAVAPILFWLPLDRYSGLGTNLIQDAWVGRTLVADPIAKLCLTALAVGIGFRGGEVTPLMAIGATAGALAAKWLELPAPLFAVVGSVVMFGATVGCPWAAVIMAGELAGWPTALAAGPVMLVGSLLRRHKALYDETLE